jgi:hypothetical protein
MGPNDQTLLSNLVATEDETYYSYNILKGNFTEVGDYSYIYNCGNAVEKETGKIDFEITYTGGKLTSQVTTIYVISLFILLVLLVGLLLFSTTLPSSDTKTEDGEILEISNLKHLRPVIYGISWGIMLAILFVMSNLTIAYLPTLMIGNLFFAFYTITFWISIVGIPLWFAWIFVNIFKDKETKNMLERGIGNSL